MTLQVILRAQLSRTDCENWMRERLATGVNCVLRQNSRKTKSWVFILTFTYTMLWVIASAGKSVGGWTIRMSRRGIWLHHISSKIDDRNDMSYDHIRRFVRSAFCTWNIAEWWYQSGVVPLLGQQLHPDEENRTGRKSSLHAMGADE